MSEVVNTGGNNPGSAGKSTPAAGVPQPTVREQFTARLTAERLEKSKTPSKPPESTQAKPPVVDQPQGDDADAGAQPLGDDSGAENELEELDRQESTDGLADGEQPEGDEIREAVLVVGDRQYTAKEVEELETKVQSYDADYRRKTQIMSRHRQEYATRSEELQGVAAFFEKLSESQKEEIDKVDITKLDQAGFAAWQSQRRVVYDGAEKLKQGMGQLRNRMKEARENMLNHQAAESAEVIKGLDKRWNNEFYGSLRDYAVKTKRYSAEEFADITDWRVMEGLIAIRDRDDVKAKVAPKKDNPQPPARQRSQRQAPQRRTPGGQFQTAKAAVLNSTNAKKDGTFRELKKRQLERERRGG